MVVFPALVLVHEKYGETDLLFGRGAVFLRHSGYSCFHFSRRFTFCSQFTCLVSDVKSFTAGELPMYA